MGYEEEYEAEPECADGEVSYTVSISINYGTVSRTTGWILSMEITSTCGIDEEMFLVRRSSSVVPEGDDDEYVDEFVSVCSPADMTLYNADTPYEGDDYYRSKSLDIIYRSSSLLTDGRTAILQDLDQLATDWKLIQNPENTEDHSFEA